MYSGLAGWNNERQAIMVDLKNANYLISEYYDELLDLFVYHLNLAVIHALIDKHMFFGECRKEGWDPMFFWNIKYILALGMGDIDDTMFGDLIEYTVPEKKSIFVEYNHKTGRWKRPTHYYRKKRKIKKKL